MLDATRLMLMLSGARKSVILWTNVHLLLTSHTTSVKFQEVSFSPVTNTVYPTVESRLAPSTGAVWEGRVLLVALSVQESHKLTTPLNSTST